MHPDLGRLELRSVAPRHLHYRRLLLLHHVLQQHRNRYHPPPAANPDYVAAAAAYKGQARTRGDVHNGIHVSAVLYDGWLPLAYCAGLPG